MHPRDSQTCSAFDGVHLITSGPLAAVVAATWRAQEAGAGGPLQVFDDRTCRPIELDLRGSEAEVLARLPAPDEPANRGPGRPKLGVTAREVTLLPRHWEWLATQPGGASACLRRLVEHARKGNDAVGNARQASEAVDRFMQVMTGNLPGHEEASRAFWRGERARFGTLTEAWPVDVRDHLRRLAAIAWDDTADAA